MSNTFPGLTNNSIEVDSHSAPTPQLAAMTVRAERIAARNHPYFNHIRTCVAIFRFHNVNLRRIERKVMPARIPVFVSSPTLLSDNQDVVRKYITGLLTSEGLEPRTLGSSDFGIDFPLKEVHSLAKHCSGGVILGFKQMIADNLIVKPGTSHQARVKEASFPTPWNNLEAGVLFTLRLPLVVFREEGVCGGVFDPGASEVFVQDLPSKFPSDRQDQLIRTVIQNWVGKVRAHYREY